MTITSSIPITGVAWAQDGSAAPKPSPSPAGSSAPSGPTPFECPSCLHAVGPEADHCPECGLSFKKLEYECPKCKASIPYDAKVCPSCGLKFDAPPAGERDKRQTSERAMPPVRDFVNNPAPASDGVEVHGSSVTLARTGMERGARGGEERVDKLVEDLNVNVIHLGLRGLSFHSAVSLMYTGAPRDLQNYGGPVQLTLREAYLRYESEDERTQIQAGRQFVNSGVETGYLDGLFAHQVFGDRLGVEGYFGHPVSTQKADPTGDWELGGRVYYRGIPKLMSRLFRDLTIGVSAVEERWDWHTVKRRIGFDLSFSPSWNYDFISHMYYDLVTEQVCDARAAFVARPASFLQLTLDYRYLVPSALLPADSIFSVFADDKRHEFEFDLDVYPLERIKIHSYAELYYIPQDKYTTTVTNATITPKDTTPYKLGVGASYKHGEVIRGELGFETSLLVKGGLQRYQGATVYGSSVLIGRVYETLSCLIDGKHLLRGSLDGMYEAYDVKIFQRRNSAFQVTGSAGYTYDSRYGITLGADWRVTPDFDSTGDFFARVEVYF